MFKQVSLGVVFVVISLAYSNEADAQYGRSLLDYCPQYRYERALYNANLLAYKQRYTQAWVANYRRTQGLSNGKPVYIYRANPRVHYYVPSTRRSVVVRY